MKCRSINKSLAWCKGSPAFSGMRKRVYFISKDSVAVWPVFERDGYGVPVDASLKGDFELVADEYFRYMDVDPSLSSHSSEAQGDWPCVTQLNRLSLVHLAVGEEASAISAYLNNKDIIYLFQDTSGMWRVVGSSKWETLTEVSQDGGSESDDVATSIAVSATDETASPFFTGKFMSEEGEIDCEPPKACFSSGSWLGHLPWLSRFLWRNKK